MGTTAAIEQVLDDLLAEATGSLAESARLWNENRNVPESITALLRGLLEERAGSRARKDGFFLMDQEEVDENPAPTPSDAWMAGYTSEDLRVRCEGAERKIKRALPDLVDLRESLENFRGVLSSFAALADRPDEIRSLSFSRKEEYIRLLNKLVRITGELPTGAVRHQLAKDASTTQEVLEIFKGTHRFGRGET